jgi:hypothetical protein
MVRDGERIFDAVNDSVRTDRGLLGDGGVGTFK